MKTLRTAFIILLLIAIGVLTALYLIIHDIAVLEPDGYIGIREKNLLIDASLLMLLVVIPAVVMCLLFAWIYRAGNKKAKYTPNWGESAWAEAIWWCIPFLIVITISIITWKTSIDLNPNRPLDIDTDKKPLTVQVVALQWKWLFLYPEQEIATINYLQIPIQTPIRFEISADAPMNSFWIPDLGGQIYAMPAMRSMLHLFADKEGSFPGHSANISGTGFAGMNFETKATTEDDFNNWVESVKQSTKDLDYKEYLELLKPTMNVPPMFYNLKQDNLFELILKQYTPEGVKEGL